MPHKSFSLAARGKSFVYAMNGLRHLLRQEHNAWIHAAATLLVLLAAILLHISLADWRWIILCICWVWFAEAINTALENLCNVVSPEKQEGIRIAKDVAAGAVLVSALGAALIGIATLAPYLPGLCHRLPFLSPLCQAFS